MKAKVNRDACIGCGACASICPDVFELDDEGLSVVISDEIEKDKQEDAKDAKDTCPTSAIEIEE